MASPTADTREAQLRDNIVLQRCRPEVVTWPNARKMASRLELLHNTTSRDVFLKRKACEFTTIEETQPFKDSGGYRFISDVMFRELFGKHLACKRITTIQVRMYSPRLSVIRSMLRRKLVIEKIHLPASKMMNHRLHADSNRMELYLQKNIDLTHTIKMCHTFALYVGAASVMDINHG